MTIACPDCGTLEDIPELPPRSTAVCVRCEGNLEKTTGRSVTAALACSLSTFLLLFPVNVLPLLRMNIFSMQGQNVIMAGVIHLWSHRWIFLAGLSAAFVVILPFIRFGLLSAVLGALKFGARPVWLGRAFRWALWLDPWAMIDVYLLAAGVGYYRLVHVQQAHVSIQFGGWCFIAAALLTMLSRATLDKRTVWRAIGGEITAELGEPLIACTTCDLIQPISREGESCPRCGAKLRARKPDSLAWTMALCVTAFILFFPSNIYPMSISMRLGTLKSYTIFDGIEGLFKNGLLPLGGLIFCTSILIPITKIFAIFWCVTSVWRRSDRHLVAKTKVVRLIAELGRWSKTDPFTIVFFVPLMHFGALGSDTAGWGATAFMLMTFLTMVASVTFDPRLMWDAAGQRAEQGRRT